MRMQTLISTTRSEPGGWTLIFGSQGHSWFSMTEGEIFTQSKEHLLCGGEAALAEVWSDLTLITYETFAKTLRESIEVGAELNNSYQSPLSSLKLTSNSRKGTQLQHSCWLLCDLF